MSRNAELEKIYQSYGHFVFRQCRKFLRNEEDARDAAQEVFVKIATNLETLSNRESLFPWIYRMTINHCLNQIEKNKHRSVHEYLDEAKHAVADQHRDFEWRDLADFLLGKFDATTREIAFCYYVDEMSQEEIAVLLGVTRRTIYNRLQAFKERCAKILAASGLSMPTNR